MEWIRFDSIGFDGTKRDSAQPLLASPLEFPLRALHLINIDTWRVASSRVARLRRSEICCCFCRLHRIEFALLYANAQEIPIDLGN